MTLPLPIPGGWSARRGAGEPPSSLDQAIARSEVRRAWAVIGVACMLLVIATLRDARQVTPAFQVIAATGLAAMIGMQCVVLWIARRSRPPGTGRGIPTWAQWATVVGESMIPTGMMVAHIAGGTLTPYAALSSPPVFVYGVIISLTTLRLRPVLCLAGGTLVAGGYLGVLAWVVFVMDERVPTTGLPLAAYGVSAFIIFTAGLAGAWVAGELRGHVRSAIRDANARQERDKLERDLAAARSIQQALLPRSVPAIPGFEVAGWNRPADQTGGDYYDWQALPDGNWMVTVADVSGHGIGPALVTAACRAYVRAAGPHHVGGAGASGLAELAGRLNRQLAEDLPEGRFVTMASALIEPTTGRVALLSAGHGPIVLLHRASGEVREIQPGNLPLAVLADAEFGPAQALTLEPGDVLALVTDGFVEWPRTDPDGRSEQFGVARLRDALRRHGDLPPPEMIQAITREVEAFAHPWPQRDDLTMAVIRRAP